MGGNSSGSSDQLEVASRQIATITAIDNRALKQRLYAMWQSRGENEVYTEELLRYFKARARLLHYVFTPLLFLPLWRWKANATRDQNDATCDFVAVSSGSAQKRSRNESGSLSKDGRPRRSHSVTSQNAAQSPQPTPPLLKTGSEQYHADLVANFIQENVQYLQTLGFQVIQLSSQQASRRSGRPSVAEKSTEDLRVTRARVMSATGPTSKNRARPQMVYLQKSLLGGILIFEIGVWEPFFVLKLHALEAQRLTPRSRQQNMPSKNFTTTFLEECDKIKLLVHLHSFTYDYHLRTVSSYVSQRPTRLRPSFHVVSFLEDFLKYYTKGPNFARNFIHSGSLHVISQVCTSTFYASFLFFPSL
jgi:hypothetical protein